jgi:hypothetical protein
MSIIFIGQMPTYFFFKSTSYVYVGTNNFNSLPPSVTVLKKDEAKFKAALRWNLNTNTFYAVDYFLYEKIDYNNVLVKCL